MKQYICSTDLNLRSTPLKGNNVITILNSSQTVELLDNSNPIWWIIKVNISSKELTGFVYSSYLLPVPDALPPVGIDLITAAVHYPTKANSRRDSIVSLHCPLSEDPHPSRNINDTKDQKINSIYDIIEFLNVEASGRYKPRERQTFCNIYAYDFCFYANAYLPRVWWTQKAILALKNGETVVPVYDKTVYELNANGLYNWLDEWGDDFAWQRTFDLTELQNNVNNGYVGIICAKRRNESKSGHIVCVVPERQTNKAIRIDTKVISPLQSQAGVVNKKLFSNDWFIRLASNFKNVGYWFHA